MTGKSHKQSSALQQLRLSQQQKKKHNNERLDEALEETFPASDPIAMLEPVPNSQQSSEDKEK